MGNTRWVLVLALMIPAAMTGQAQIITDMSPERIRQAIAFGTSERDLGWYRIQEKARWSWPPLIATYTTPYLRVALAANEAKKRYKIFTAAEVTPDMLAPVIVVRAWSRYSVDREVANVLMIVLLPHDSKDAAEAIHATEMQDASQFGFTEKGKGLLAVFPLESWREDKDLRVVFDREIPGSHADDAHLPSSTGSCKDCKSRIYLKSVQ